MLLTEPIAAWAAESNSRAGADHVHFTRDGYAQLGALFHEASARANGVAPRFGVLALRDGGVHTLKIIPYRRRGGACPRPPIARRALGRIDANEGTGSPGSRGRRAARKGLRIGLQRGRLDVPARNGDLHLRCQAGVGD